MREILFRGKVKNTNEWQYGDLRHWTKKSVGIHHQELHTTLRVIPETVGQYTGLTDKNGTKIFEGDIVKIELYHPKGFANYEIGYIKYDDTKSRFIFCTNEGEYSYDNSDVFTVIGNIHDNPELIESEDNK